MQTAKDDWIFWPKTISRTFGDKTYFTLSYMSLIAFLFVPENNSAFNLVASYISRWFTPDFHNYPQYAYFSGVSPICFTGYFFLAGFPASSIVINSIDACRSKKRTARIIGVMAIIIMASLIVIGNAVLYCNYVFM